LFFLVGSRARTPKETAGASPIDPEGSVEWYFHEAKTNDALLDFRFAPKEGVIANWLKAPHGMQSIGSTISKE
jgi:hypothetical protein